MYRLASLDGQPTEKGRNLLAGCFAKNERREKARIEIKLVSK
jgi:hypothetical protein